MPGYLLYTRTTGALLQYMEIADEEVDLYEDATRAAIAVPALPDLSAIYVPDGTLTPRPDLAGFDKTSILADGADTATLSGLPDPCMALINGLEHTITGGTLELDADYPGTWRVEIRYFPYRDFVQEITAT